jgi:protein O-GlcNAc transferase
MNSNLLTIHDAVRLHLSGKLNEAETVYRLLLQSDPANPEALHLLGVISYQRGRYEEAEDLIGRAIAINKRAAEYRNNLGNVYLAQGRLDAAGECYRKALKLQPKYVDARNNLGNVFREQGNLQESVNAYQKALALDPKRPEIHNNLGMVLLTLARAAEAEDHFSEAVRLKPDFVEALSNLSAAYKQQEKQQDAIACGFKVLEMNPRHAKTLLNIGNAYSELNQMDKGLVFFRQALNVDPNLCEAHLNIAHILRHGGKKEEALVHYQEAIRLKPNSLAARFGNCLGQIPLHHDSMEEIVLARGNYRNELASLHQYVNLADPHIRNQALTLVGNCQPFFLAYQGENDRELQSLYGDLIVKIQSACFPQWSQKRPMPQLKPGEPIRVGILSGYYFLNSNWKIPIKGWVENLNRQDFQLYGYYTGHRVDSQTEVARKTFYRFAENLGSHQEWCERIVQDRLHILIIPEVGMDVMTVRLASLRLAPIQCTSWGHPDTSGLSTIDYYLSSDLMEPEDAQDHYCEKLIRLPNLSIHYEPPDIPTAQADRAHFGLRDDCPLFISTQSLFKYLPQYDEVFPRIAAETGPCQIAFLSYDKSSLLGEQFMERLQSSFSRFGLRCEDYVKMLPHLDPPHYRALNLIADVFLDSIGWSGCNSTMEALACDLPIVTMPGKLMRGRHTHAILKMMEMSDMEARNIDEYVSIATRLVKEQEWRREVAQRISRSKHLAYRDNECIRGLESFIKQAVGAVR